MLSVINHSPILKSLINLAAVAALGLAIGLSVSFGATDISFATVWQAVTQFNPALTTHQIIQELRLPRAFAAALVGAFLAVAGALMQGMTRDRKSVV